MSAYAPIDHCTNFHLGALQIKKCHKTRNTNDTCLYWELYHWFGTPIFISHMSILTSFRLWKYRSNGSKLLLVTLYKMGFPRDHVDTCQAVNILSLSHFFILKRVPMYQNIPDTCTYELWSYYGYLFSHRFPYWDVSHYRKVSRTLVTLSTFYFDTIPNGNVEYCKNYFSDTPGPYWHNSYCENYLYETGVILQVTYCTNGLTPVWAYAWHIGELFSHVSNVQVSYGK